MVDKFPEINLKISEKVFNIYTRVICSFESSMYDDLSIDVADSPIHILLG